MTVVIRSQRAYPRIKLNWPVEYRIQVEEDHWIHEGAKMEDYSLSGACILAMSELQTGMKITVAIKPPSGEQIELRGEIVRIDESVDVGRMFKAVGVRWALEVFNQLITDSPVPLKDVYGSINP
jgi:hypothetical protein